MYQKQITYTDFNGETRTETFLFHISKAELAEMELSKTGGFQNYIQRIVAADDRETLISLFKDIILKSYGEKDATGKRFIKSEELSTQFSQTNAYSDLFMELITDTKAATEFVNGIVPEELRDKVLEAAE